MKLNSGTLLHATVCSCVGGLELKPSWIIPCDLPRDIILHCPLRSTLPRIGCYNLLPENSFHSTGNIVFMRINLISYSYRWKKNCVMFTECVLLFLFTGLLFETFNHVYRYCGLVMEGDT